MIAIVATITMLTTRVKGRRNPVVPTYALALRLRLDAAAAVVGRIPIPTLCIIVESLQKPFWRQERGVEV